MKGIVHFFIRQHKVANLIVVMLLVVGCFYFWKSPKEGFPQVDFDLVVITTPYLGASAEEVENLVTRKVEEALDGISGKKMIRSTSVEGASTVVFELDPDTGVKIEDAVSDIRTALDSIRNELPNELESDPLVTEINSDVFPVISVIIAGNVDEAILRNVVEMYEERAKKIDGVARLQKVDYRDREVWVEVKAPKLREYDLEIGDVLMAIQNRSLNMPGGKITAAGKDYLIRTIGQYENIEEIKNTVVRANDSSQVVRVKDVAKVRMTFENIERATRIQGYNGIVLNIIKKQGSDIIETSDAIKDLIKEFENKDLLPKNVRIFTADDLSFYVKRRLGILTQNATLGLVLVFLCLILFFDIRTTFWTTLGVPIAFCLGMIVMSSAGVTFNLITMFGFIMVVGMIVDDAIVVSENIYRHKEMGKSSMEAAIIGTKEVLIPVTGMVFTTVVAFAPILMISGIIGKFLASLPKVVIATMVASYFECLLILPGHMAFLKKQKATANNKKSKDVHEKRAWFKRVQKGYEWMIRRLVRRPLLSILGAIVISAGILFTTSRLVPFVFFAGSIDEFFVKVETPKGTALEKTQSVVDEIEMNIRQNVGEHIREYISSVGFFSNDGGASLKGTHYGTIRIVMNPGEPVPEKQLVQLIEEQVTRVEGIEKYSVKQVRGGPPQDKPIFLKFISQDTNLMERVAKEMMNHIKEISNTTSIEVSTETGKDEYRLKINEEMASVLGVNTLKTASSVRIAFDGGKAAVARSMHGINEDVDIIVKYPKDFKKTQKDLQQIKIKNAFGQNIALSEFATIERGKSINAISKEDLSEYVSVTSELVNKRSREYNAKKINAMLLKKMEELETSYPNVRIEMGGDAREQSDQIQSAKIAFLAALMAVLIILTSLFKSYLQPFVVMCAIPFAWVGVMLGLLITHTPMGFFPMIGMIALTGVVVNDSMVLVSFINKIRNEGKELREAIVEASVKRLRPIILTTFTTAVGIAPLAYGILGREPFLEPMAIAILWGLCFSTFVILGIIPCLYYVVDSFAQFVYRILKIPYKLPGAVE